MSYSDYKTGRSISREQYIERGLERGELLAIWDCGCTTIKDRTAGTYIVYCYKHEAAEDMYEALEKISVILANPLTTRTEATLELRVARARDEAWIIAREAKAKAEGKE